MTISVTTVRPVKGVGWNVLHEVGGVEKSLILFQRKADAIAEAEVLHELAVALWEIGPVPRERPILRIQEDVDNGTA